jgi:ribosomal protein L12E/L44/L45/RPP1/RPP2
MQRFADKIFDGVLAGFGRAEELEADKVGVVLASKVGYSPAGLGDFLTRLTERNKESTAKRGLMRSHPETKERLEKLKAQIAKEKLTGTATLEDRYKEHIKYEAKSITEIAAGVAGASGLTGSEPAAKAEPKAETKAEPKAEEKKEEPKKRGFGLGSLMKPGGEERKSAQVSASGGTRGVGDPEVDAKGGPNPKPVTVTLTAAEIDAFKKAGKIGG